MKRIAFRVLAGVSLALLLVASVAWMRSYRHSDFVRVTSVPVRQVMTSPEQIEAWERVRTTMGWDGMYTSNYVAIACNRGNAYLFFGKEGEMVKDRRVPPPRVTWGGNSADILLVDDSPVFRMGLGTMATRDVRYWGFSYLHFAFGTASDTRRIGVPLWALTGLTAVLPSLWAWRGIAAYRRTKIGCCARCGYDLRMTPDRCPECGTRKPSVGSNSPAS